MIVMGILPKIDLSVSPNSCISLPTMKHILKHFLPQEGCVDKISGLYMSETVFVFMHD